MDQATEKQLTYRQDLIASWFTAERVLVFDTIKLAEGSKLQKKLVNLALLLAAPTPTTKQQASREIDLLLQLSPKTPRAFAEVAGVADLIPALEVAALDWGHLPADAEKDPSGRLTAAGMRAWVGNVLAAAQSVMA